MKKILIVLAVLVLVIGSATWLVTGKNMGWSKTKKAISKTDPITEIVYTDYEKGFYPGIDFLGATVLVALGFFGISNLSGKDQNIFSAHPTACAVYECRTP